MNWKLKAAVQQVFSHLPLGDKLNYFAQRHVLNNLPVSDSLFLEKIREANRHYTAFLQHSKFDKETVAKAKCYEFGAGWDMIIPLTYYALGIDVQLLVDVKPLLKVSLINNAISRFHQHAKELDLPRSIDPERLRKEDTPVGLKERFGIDYLAPLNATNTNLPAESFDFISSTNTLEHVPESRLLSLLEECYRILKSGGIMSCRIDYQDHYAYIDSKISVYNFLQFAKDQWKKWNPFLQYQNRIRHKEFMNMVRKTNFTIAEVVAYEPLKEDITLIKQLPLAKEFQSFTAEELAVRWAYVILKK